LARWCIHDDYGSSSGSSIGTAGTPRFKLGDSRSVVVTESDGLAELQRCRMLVQSAKQLLK